MSQWTRPDPDMPISEDTARAQVMLLLEGYDIDPAAHEDASRSAIETSLDKLAKYVRRGIIEIAPDLTVTQHRKSGPDVKYAKLTGKAVIASDSASADKPNAKIHALLGALSGLPVEAFQALPGDELSVAETLAIVFFSR